MTDEYCNFEQYHMELGLASTRREVAMNHGEDEGNFDVRLVLAQIVDAVVAATPGLVRASGDHTLRKDTGPDHYANEGKAKGEARDEGEEGNIIGAVLAELVDKLIDGGASSSAAALQFSSGGCAAGSAVHTVRSLRGLGSCPGDKDRAMSDGGNVEQSELDGGPEIVGGPVVAEASGSHPGPAAPQTVAELRRELEEFKRATAALLEPDGTPPRVQARVERKQHLASRLRKAVNATRAANKFKLLQQRAQEARELELRRKGALEMNEALATSKAQRQSAQQAQDSDAQLERRGRRGLVLMRAIVKLKQGGVRQRRSRDQWDGHSRLDGLVYDSRGKLCMWKAEKRSKGLHPDLPCDIAAKLKRRELRLKERWLDLPSIVTATS